MDNFRYGFGWFLDASPSFSSPLAYLNSEMFDPSAVFKKLQMKEETMCCFLEKQRDPGVSLSLEVAGTLFAQVTSENGTSKPFIIVQLRKRKKERL